MGGCQDKERGSYRSLNAHIERALLNLRQARKLKLCVSIDTPRAFSASSEGPSHTVTTITARAQFPGLGTRATYAWKGCRKEKEGVRTRSLTIARFLLSMMCNVRNGQKSESFFDQCLCKLYYRPLKVRSDGYLTAKLNNCTSPAH